MDQNTFDMQWKNSLLHYVFGFYKATGDNMNLMVVVKILFTQLFPSRHLESADKYKI